MIIELWDAEDNTFSTDINIPPSNVFALASMNTFTFSAGAVPWINTCAGVAFTGFTGYTKVDPNTQVPTMVDLTGFAHGLQPAFFDNGVDSITYIIEGIGVNDGSTSGCATIFFFNQDGSLS